MTLYEKMMNIDRRWIYLLLMITVLIPAIVPFEVPVATTPEVRSVFKFVDDLKEGDYLFLGIDYDPSTMAELHPMSKAIMSQCFEKGVKVILTALSQNGPGMAEQVINEISTRYHRKNHVDYCFLGYKPYPGIVVLNMGVNFKLTFPNDYYGVPLDSIPVMRGIKNYLDCAGVIDICAGNIADMWVQYGNGRYGVPLALGVTGVMASDYYPYLQSGQIFGIIPGMKGAAEYEKLSGFKTTAIRSMAYQTTSHIIILLFIIISNIGYVFGGREEKKLG
jgi:hypothetical protein